MITQARRAEKGILAFALLQSVPTLLGVWLLELGRRTQAFEWPWAPQAPSFKLVGGFVTLLYVVVAGVWMTRRLFAHHHVLSPRRQQMVTVAYVLLGQAVGTEIWAPFFDMKQCPEMIPVVLVNRLLAIPLTAFLAAAYVSIYRAVDERLVNERAMSARLLEQSTTDALTGLPNRFAFLQQLEVALEEARKSGRSVAVFFVDLDRFKLVNDTLGHEVGDALLCELGRRLSGGLRGQDAVARIGGDEFVGFASGLTAEGTESAQLGERLLEDLVKPVVIDGHELVCTGSVGYALYPTDGIDVGTLVRNADRAMYQAKQRGRNLAARFEPRMAAEAEERLQLEQELRQALARNELYLEYQPQVNSRAARVVGFEALVRWNNPRRGRLGADTFIPIAEDSGLIVDLDRWVLKTACNQLAVWRAHAPDLVISVNFSARNFNRDDVVSTVATQLVASGLPAQALDLEITERALMAFTPGTLSALAQLRVLGVSLTLDDFGTGYSALGYLSRFQVDALKIDRSLVRGAQENRTDAAVATALVALAQKLDLRIVAEGVETESELQWIREIGCELVQGFLFSAPVPPEAVLRLLTTPQTRWNRLRTIRQVS